MITGRYALAPVSESKLNSNNFSQNCIRSFAGDTKDLKHRTNHHNMTLRRSMTVGLGEEDLVYKRARTTPRQEKARILKMRLQLAYYKVKTNQTDVPIHRLRFPKEGDNNLTGTYSSPQSPTRGAAESGKGMDALSDLLAASSPLLKKSSHKLHRKANTISVSRNTGLSPTFEESVLRRSNVSRTLNPRTQRHGKLENVVARRSSRISQHSAFKRSEHITNGSRRIGLTLPTPFLHQSFSSKTSPSRFVISPNCATTHTGKDNFLLPGVSSTLPPIPVSQLSDTRSARPARQLNLLNSEGNATCHQKRHSASEALHYKDIGQDADATIPQNTSSLIMSTPTKIPKIVPTSILDKDKAVDQDETQIQSPLRVLSTPSSIGAAKCLLQLARR